MCLSSLVDAYASGAATPSSVMKALYPALAAEKAMFITLAPLADLLERCRELETVPTSARKRLWAVPFAVKDNIDVAGFPTTAACPSFQYMPACSAPVVQALLDAGGVMVGKTNMDQFAAGLVGTRSPYGTPRNPFDDRFLPGGSSSGSGAAVGAGLVCFALGTDTAGSGRVPAHFCGCVGIKPTVGRTSTEGVVPACRSLDCVSVFARSVPDAAVVVRIMQGAGELLADPTWRTPPAPCSTDLLRNFPHALCNIPGRSYQAPSTPTTPPANGSFVTAADGAAEPVEAAFRFAVPGPDHIDFSGPGGDSFVQGYKALFEEAAGRLEALGGQRVPINFAPMAEVARLLYESAFVAERYSGIRSFLEKPFGKMPTPEQIMADGRMERVTAAILSGAPRFSAADVYDGLARLAELAARARTEFTRVDFLLVPSALHHYLISEVEAEEKVSPEASWPKNAKLGRFTNFVNLLDLAAVAVPSGVLHCRANALATGAAAERERRLAESGNPTPSLPFGVTLIGAAWRDEALWAVAAELHSASGLGCGPEGHGVKPYRIRAHNIHPGTTAHISGKSHPYVTFAVNGKEESTSVLDSEASAHAVWRDTVTLNLDSTAGELKVTVYNKRKLIHDHEIGSSHIDLKHLTTSPGAEVRMVLMGKGQQQGEISFTPELKLAGGSSATTAQHATPAVAAGGLAAGGGAAVGHANHGDTNPAAEHGELSLKANHGKGLGGSSVLAADKAAVSSSAAEPASKGGYASHVAAPGVEAPSGPPAGHGEFVNHDKPSGATAGFGGGGAATFDNRGVPTGKAHPDNQPKPASPSLYPTSGSSVSDPATDLTNPTGDWTTAPHSGAGTGAGLATGAGVGAGLGAMAGAHKDGASAATGTKQPQGGSMLDKAKETATGAAASVQQGATNLKERAFGTSAPAEGGAPAQSGSMLDKAKETAAGAAASVQQGATNLKERAFGTSAPAQQGTATTGSFAPASGTTHVGAPLSTSEAEHADAPLTGSTEHKEFASALDPVAGGAPAAGEGEQSSLLGRAQAVASSAVGAVTGAPRAAYNTATGATQAVYQRVTGSSPTASPGAGGETVTKTEHTTETEGVGAKPTLTERAKGLTATAIDTTTHLLDQAKIHVTGHGTGEPVEAPKTMTSTAMAYTAKAIDLTTSVLDTAKGKIVGSASPTAATADIKPTSHVLPEQ
ncbi:hypothetical protein WJX81_007895 [Elliptochloris bilobata]|uniref:C2 domain-containing protein n=1 Tax=Elliptochloris bilobata TaxID=381761 RepID=A0AAW1RNU0_9CHLO